jgi:hypothetical protein
MTNDHMTTVRLSIDHRAAGVRVVGRVLLAVSAVLLLLQLLPPAAAAQERPVHRLYDPALPPGAIGSRRLIANGPLSGFFREEIQPVELRGPAGLRIAIAEEGAFGEPLAAPLLVGMNIGPVYRMRVTNIPYRPGVEVYPSLEVIDRLYPPAAKALEFPIPVDLTEEDLGLAANGLLVTRVIYVEDPQQATPVVGDPRKPSWLDVSRGEDPLAAAIHLGRPVAILRIGSRVPDFSGADAACLVAPHVTYFEPPGGYPEDAQP